MEPARLLVQDHGHALHLEVFARDVLRPTNDLLSDVVRPGLAESRVVAGDFPALLLHNLVDDALNTLLDAFELVFLPGFNG